MSVSADRLYFHAPPGRGCLSVTGADRVAWLNGIVTADVARVKPGTAAFGLLLNKQGKIQSDLVFAASEQTIFLGPALSARSAVVEMLDHMLVMEDAELTDESGAHMWFFLIGPGSAELAQSAAVGGAAGTIGWLEAAEAAVMVVPSARRPQVEGAFAAAGASALDAAAWDAARIAHALPSFGVDYGDGDNPHQASLDQRAVSWDKGCYLGQEVVCMQDMRGKVKRRVSFVEIPPGAAVEPGAEVFDTADGAAVGEITSVAPDAAGGFLALARLPAALSEAGAQVFVAGRDARVRASAAGRD